MRRVILESPYQAGTGLKGLVGRWMNRRYARRCVRHSLSLGEAPIASHLLYTQPGILRDHDAHERQWGIAAGLAWRQVADASVVYIDRGVSIGMQHGIIAAEEAGIPVIMRSIKKNRPVERDGAEQALWI